jgi:hypothetical protein
MEDILNGWSPADDDEYLDNFVEESVPGHSDSHNQ